MTRKNLFSVLICVYYNDNAKLFHRALKSIYDSSLKPSEVILVQDGPVGYELNEVIIRFTKHLNFRHVILEENQGLAVALNTGLRFVSTSYVFRMDADDLNLPDRFAKQLPLLVYGYDLVGGYILEVDLQGMPISIRNVPCSEKEIHKSLLKRSPFNHVTTAFRFDTVNKLGGYPNIFLKEDYALWALMIASGAKVHNIKDILVHVTAGREMYSRRGGLRYVYSEIGMQRLFLKLKLQSPSKAFLIGFGRSLIFLMPNFFRSLIYRHFLRKSV